MVEKNLKTRPRGLPKPTPSRRPAVADRHDQEMRFMVRALRPRPVLVGKGEVLVAAVRYVVIMLSFIVLLGHLAKVAL
jgi:hypothetical protein